MKAIKDAEYIIDIWACSNGFFWNAYTKDGLGYDCKYATSAPEGFHNVPFKQGHITQGAGYKHKSSAIRAWRRFVQINSIVNYRIIKS